MRLGCFIGDLVQAELHILVTFFYSIHGTHPLYNLVREVFEQLRYLLETIFAQFPVSDLGVWTKFTFSFLGKKSLDNACGDLEQWYIRFLWCAVFFLVIGRPEQAAENAVIGQSQLLNRVQRIRRAIQDPTPDPMVAKLYPDAFESSVELIQLDSSSVYVLDVGAELAEHRMYDAHAPPGEILPLWACFVVAGYLRILLTTDSHFL